MRANLKTVSVLVAITSALTLFGSPQNLRADIIQVTGSTTGNYEKAKFTTQFTLTLNISGLPLDTSTGRQIVGMIDGFQLSTSTGWSISGSSGYAYVDGYGDSGCYCSPQIEFGIYGISAPYPETSVGGNIELPDGWVGTGPVLLESCCIPSGITFITYVPQDQKVETFQTYLTSGTSSIISSAVPEPDTGLAAGAFLAALSCVGFVRRRMEGRRRPVSLIPGLLCSKRRR